MTDVTITVSEAPVEIVVIDPAKVGPKGDAGADGLSAYEVAVEAGFVGTEEEWLLSLKGTNGTDGWTYVWLTADFSHNTASYTPTPLTFAVAANKTYEIETFGRFSSENTSNGPGFRFSSPGDAAFLHGLFYTVTNSSGTMGAQSQNPDGLAVPHTLLSTNSVYATFQGKHFCKTGPSAGNITLEFAVELYGYASTLMRYQTFIRYKEIEHVQPV